MISLATIDRVHQGLNAFRTGGLIRFDGRDRGNYCGYEEQQESELYRRHDPTGLAEALILDAKIEATIAGSVVELARVLREEHYLPRLAEILRLKAQLEAELAAPRAALAGYLEEALAGLSAGLGAPTDLELAICLRDAIFCLDQGLQLRWLQCDDVAMAPHVPLCPQINQYEDSAAFAAALRETLPHGAHLARIGTTMTAIGIKQPGRIALLSSQGINTATGTMDEKRAGSILAEDFDLDHMVQRYPVWVTSHRDPGYTGFGEKRIVIGRDSHEINHLSLLPRDRIIWLAMTVEMVSQKMAATTDAELCESLSRALPPGSGGSNLPLVIPPNWQAQELTLPAVLAELQLSTWELGFLAPALEGATAEMFLPAGRGAVVCDLDSRELRPWTRDFGSSFSKSEGSVRFRCVADDWIGTRGEIEAARRTMCARNLATYLLAWGNRRFRQEWAATTPWVAEKLRANLEEALRHPCVRLASPDTCRRGVHLYSQSRRHKGYTPRCVFNDKHEVGAVAIVAPADSAELCQVLGLDGEEGLPDFLRGWRREISWTTCEPPGGPVDIDDRWCFMDNDFAGDPCRVEAFVSLSSQVAENLPAAATRGRVRKELCDEWEP